MRTKKFRDTKEKMMGSFFLSSGGTDCVVIDYRSCYEEPMKDSESIALTTPDNRTVVVTKKELQEDYNFFQQGKTTITDWCLL